MSNHSKAKEEKKAKTLYLSVSVQDVIAKMAVAEERSESYIANSLLQKALGSKVLKAA